jgi:hypothetical protein
MPEPNGDEKTRMSPHLVEAQDLGTDSILWAAGIEEMYDRLEQRAKDDDSIIMNKVQNVEMYVTQEGGSSIRGMVVVLTAQRIGREELERQQRQMMLQQGRR